MAIRSSGQASIRFNQNALNKVLKGRNGPVVLHVANSARAVLGEARRLAPKGSGLSGSGRPKPGPRLRDSGSMHLIKVGDRWNARITFNAEHALSVILGARPHQITGNPLRFKWDKAPSAAASVLAAAPTGGSDLDRIRRRKAEKRAQQNPENWFSTFSVRHPGNPGRNFLEQAMRNKGLKGIKVTRRG